MFALAHQKLARASAFAVVVLLLGVAGCNRGAETSCASFMSMDHHDRLQVVKKTYGPGSASSNEANVRYLEHACRSEIKSDRPQTPVGVLSG